MEKKTKLLRRVNNKHSKVTKRADAIEHDKERDWAEEWELYFKRDWANAMDEVANQCLADFERKAEADEQTEIELLNTELGKLLANSQAAAEDYYWRQVEFKSRFKK